MSNMERYGEYKGIIEKRLGKFFAETEAPHTRLFESMRYSLLAGGKRIRPVLTLEFCRACGGNPMEALESACAIEMLHTYSLIHDDLPCMDDDDIRRGKPSNHAVYGEMTAVLAGDALQAAAFNTILASRLSSRIRAECALVLSQAAGADGICAGQYMDMINEGKAITEAALRDIHLRKTSALIEASCLMGAVIAEAPREQKEAARGYARALGLAFQIRDDVLDAIGDDKRLGKPTGSDKRGDKTTFMTLLGETGCKEFIASLINNAKSSVTETFNDSGFLCELADSMRDRQY